MKKIIIGTLLAFALCEDATMGIVSSTKQVKATMTTQTKGLRNNLKSSKSNQQPKNSQKNGGAKTISSSNTNNKKPPTNQDKTIDQYKQAQLNHQVKLHLHPQQAKNPTPKPQQKKGLRTQEQGKLEPKAQKTQDKSIKPLQKKQPAKPQNVQIKTNQKKQNAQNNQNKAQNQVHQTPQQHKRSKQAQRLRGKANNWKNFITKDSSTKPVSKEVKKGQEAPKPVISQPIAYKTQNQSKSRPFKPSNVYNSQQYPNLSQIRVVTGGPLPPAPPIPLQEQPVTGGPGPLPPALPLEDQTPIIGGPLPPAPQIYVEDQKPVIGGPLPPASSI